MNFFKPFIFTVVILNSALVVYFAIFWSVSAVINLQISLLGSVAILVTTYFGYKQMIENKLSQTAQPLDDEVVNSESKNEAEEDDEEEELKPTKSEALRQSYKGFLYPLRLLSYVVFATSFIYLATNNSLEVVPFLVGLAIAPIAILFTTYFLKGESE